jgi:hypothetical protein
LRQKQKSASASAAELVPNDPRKVDYAPDDGANDLQRVSMNSTMGGVTVLPVAAAMRQKQEPLQAKAASLASLERITA